MTHLRYDAGTPGGKLAAEAAAKLLSAIEDFQNLKGLADQVGNMTMLGADGNAGRIYSLYQAD